MAPAPARKWHGTRRRDVGMCACDFKKGGADDRPLSTFWAGPTAGLFIV